MRKYLEIEFRDAIYRVDLNYIMGLHAARLGQLRDDCLEVTELFFNDVRKKLQLLSDKGGPSRRIRGPNRIGMF